MTPTHPTRATLTLAPVQQVQQDVSVDLGLQLSFPMPAQDEGLPSAIEAYVHHAGLQIQRALFTALIQHADSQLVLAARGGAGEAGIQLRGTRSFTFKTLFGTVVVDRIRVADRATGRLSTPSAEAWGTAHRCELTRGLREAICDQMADESASAARGDVGERAGEPDLLSKATILEVVHSEGEALLEAIGLRDEQALDPDRDRTTDTPVGTDIPDGPHLAAEPSHGPATDQVPVVVQVDEVKTKAQAHTGRKEIWVYTAVAMVGSWSHLLVAADPAGLARQLAALLGRLGVDRGRSPLEVVADGAGWIRAWYQALEVPGKTMILCWYHLRKKCYQTISGSGLPKEEKKALLGRVLRPLWEGRVDEAILELREVRDAASRPRWIDGLIGYLEARRAYLPDYRSRKEAGRVNASHRVEKLNDWAVSHRCKGRGMSWTSAGVMALAVLQATRRNGELEAWRRDGRLPEFRLPPEVIRRAA